VTEGYIKLRKHTFGSSCQRFLVRQQEAITLGQKGTNIRKPFKQSNISLLSQIQEKSSKNAQHSRHPALKRPLLCKTKAAFCYVSSATEVKPVIQPGINTEIQNLKPH